MNQLGEHVNWCCENDKLVFTHVNSFWKLWNIFDVMYIYLFKAQSLFKLFIEEKEVKSKKNISYLFNDSVHMK